MKILNKHLLILFLKIFICHEYPQFRIPWIPFKDEKCYKILDGPTKTFEEAEKSCSELDNNPTLPIIVSTEEQEFLANYLLKTAGKVDNFWLGAEFFVDGFHWIDNTTNFQFVNWDKDGPHSKANYCVEIQSDEKKLGKWVDESCLKRNAVVCQRMQTWSIVRLQKTLLDTRKELKDLITDHNDARNHIKLIELNPVPLGFIYVQLSSQPDPKSLWSAVEWKDVTSEYAGLFFRAEGSGSAQFGSVQDENVPKITEVRYVDFTNSIQTWPFKTTLNSGGWSSGFVFSGSSVPSEKYIGQQFYQSGGEVRPRNTAIRVWKRIK